MAKANSTGTRIRVGIGGWTYAPWRGDFYPDDLPQKRELNFASRQLTAIEINATYHGTMKAQSFRNWHDDTPDDFVFSLKASRYATNRKLLASAGDSIDRFIGSGIEGLGNKLGPIVWQFSPTKQFDPADFAAFMALLPTKLGRLKLRHVMEVRHASFMTPAFIALLRRHRMATVFTDSGKYPSFADPGTDLFYARLMNGSAKLKNGYAPRMLDRWAADAALWASGGVPDGLATIEPTAASKAKPRDVFVFFINGAKEKAPAAASALIARLNKQ